MLENKTVAVVVPCYNEETQIERVLTTLPAFVDLAIVVDDASTDGTVGLVRKFIEGRGGEQASKTILLQLEKNSGVGAAIVAGYREAARRQIDVTAVMAGDAQMDPAELVTLAGPVARGETDYAKGNRLFYRGAWETIPRHRYLGNAFLSMLTKIASGYWHVADSQTGYTAISLKALQTIEMDGIYPRYGYPNDMLVRLNVYSFRVRDVPIRPVYNVGERSKMKMWKVVPTMSLADLQAVFVADAREVHHPRLPSAGVLLRVRRVVVGRRPGVWALFAFPPYPGWAGGGNQRAGGRLPVHDGPATAAVRHVVRYGVQQGPEIAA